MLDTKKNMQTFFNNRNVTKAKLSLHDRNSGD